MTNENEIKNKPHSWLQVGMYSVKTQSKN